MSGPKDFAISSEHGDEGRDPDIPEGAVRQTEESDVRLPSVAEMRRFSISSETPLLEVVRTYYDKAGSVLKFSYMLYMRGAEHVVNFDHSPESLKEEMASPDHW